MNITPSLSMLLPWLWLTQTYAFSIRNSIAARQRRFSALNAAPKRLEDNVEGVVYVNEKCINCAACSHFAPTVFERAGNHHRVHHQPSDPLEVDHARAALAACPVAAIRVQTQAHRHHNNLKDLSSEEQELVQAMALSPKHNNLEMPFPRPLLPDVYFVGYHNEHSFGATPYLTQIKHGNDLVWIMIDTPRFSPQSKNAITSLTGPNGPNYHFLTHVDDTAGHLDWKREFPSLKRIFHSGDLGPFNWVGDSSLETVEILLEPPTNKDSDNEELTMYSLEGKVLETTQGENAIILHTPGHSPGSISLYLPPKNKVHPGIVFTGDTYAFSTRTDGMSGFPQYGNNLQTQAKTLQKLLDLEWDIIAPGHGHHKDYTHIEHKEEMKRHDVEIAIDEMKLNRKWRY